MIEHDLLGNITVPDDNIMEPRHRDLSNYVWLPERNWSVILRSSTVWRLLKRLMRRHIKVWAY